MSEDPGLTAAIAVLASTSSRYCREAYILIFEALSFARSQNRVGGHMAAAELNRSLLDYAWKEYGPLAPAVLSEWGVNSPEDVGELVYNLIEVNLLSASPSDSKADFQQLAEWFVAEELSKEPAPPLPRID